LNYALGTNAAQIAVTGNLMLGGTVNVTAGGGFTNGAYTLITYAGNSSGTLPTLGTTPPGYNYAFDTSTAGQVKLDVSLPAPAAPANLTATASNLLINLNWNAVAGATSYNLKRGTSNNGPYPTIFSGLVATNYSDAAVTNTVTYFYVVTAVNSGGESTNSNQASAAPLPSMASTSVAAQISGNQLQLSWPQDHIGWLLQIQTNSPGTGLGTNWVAVSDSQLTNQIFIPVDPANGCVFLRLMYP
jgi:hypothetical protein